MKSIFFTDEVPGLKKYGIWCNTENLPFKLSKDRIEAHSLNVLQARVLNLSFANYLRFCRDEYGAELIGKGSTFPYPRFASKNQANELVKLLNKNITEALKEFKNVKEEN
mgnify:CR=1 FL=1